MFKCLLLEGENHGEGAMRDAERFLISNEQYQAFLQRHSAYSPVAENNEVESDLCNVLIAG